MTTTETNTDPIAEEDLRRASYELFMFVLSFIAVLNTALIELDLVYPTNVEVLQTINIGLSLIFFGDFLVRFFTAPSKTAYFFRQFGWADLLSSFPKPAFQLFRLFRMVRGMISLRRLGGRRVLGELSHNRAGGALYLALGIAVILIEVASTSIIKIEATSPDANIKTASDAIWWVYVTITTVGYGDYYPVTNKGRILGVLVMTIGVGLFGVLSGFLANSFLGSSRSESKSTDAEAKESITAPITMSGPQAQLAELEGLLAAQEANLAEIRRQLAQLDSQLAAPASEDTARA